MSEQHTDYLEKPEHYRSSDVSDQVANILGNWPFLDKTRKLTRLFIITNFGLPKSPGYTELQAEDGKTRITHTSLNNMTIFNVSDDEVGENTKTIHKQQKVLLPTTDTDRSFLNSGVGRFLLDECVNRDYYEQFPVAVWTYLFSTFDEILRGMFCCTEGQTGDNTHSKRYLNNLSSPKKIIQWCKAQGSKRPDPVDLVMRNLGIFVKFLVEINEEHRKNGLSNKFDPSTIIKHMLEGDLTRCLDLRSVKSCYQDLHKFSKTELIRKFRENRKYFYNMLHAAEFIINQSFQLARDPDRIIKRSKPKTNKTTFIPKYQLNMTRGGIKNIDGLILVMVCFVNDVFQDGPRLQCKCCAEREDKIGCDSIDFEERLLTDLYKTRGDEFHNPWLHLAMCNRLNKITNRFRYESTHEDEFDSQWTFSLENKKFLANEFLSSAFLTLLMQDPDSGMFFDLNDKNFGLMTIMGTLGRIFDEEQIDEIGIYGCNVTSMGYLLLAYHHLIDHHDDTQDIDKQIILVLIKHIDKMRSRLIKVNGIE